MFCTKCGYKISNGITVCPKCGNIIQQTGGQDSFRSVDDKKFDRSDYINKYGDIPDMDGVGVDLDDDRMGETIELRFDANNVGKSSVDLDVTSVIRAEDAPRAEEINAVAQSTVQGQQNASSQGAGSVQDKTAQGIPTSPAQGAGQYTGAPISSHNIPGAPAQPPVQGANPSAYNTNPLKQEIKYGESLKQSEANKKAWTIAGVFAFLALAAVIIVSVIINNDKSSGKKNDIEAKAWGEGFTEKHILKHVDAVAATLSSPGKGEYWHCDYCGKDFSDMAGEKEIDSETLTTYIFDKSLKGIQEYDGKLYYVKDGIVDAGFSGTEKYGDDVYSFKAGVFDDSFTGIYKIDNTLMYFKSGKSDKTFSGFEKFEDNWYYLTDGIVDENLVDVIKGSVNGEEAWWYIANGKVSFIDTVAKNANGWWYIKSGKIEFVDAIGQNDKGKFYCKGGKVDFGFNGKVEINGIIYEIKGGKVESEKKADEVTDNTTTDNNTSDNK